MAAKKKPTIPSETPAAGKAGPAKKAPTTKTAAKVSPSKPTPTPATPAKTAPAKTPSSRKTPTALGGEMRFRQIEEAAYYIAQASGWTRDATECWLEAEAQIDGQSAG